MPRFANHIFSLLLALASIAQDQNGDRKDSQRQEGGVFFRWRDNETGSPGTTVWSVFEKDSTYFEPTRAPFMLNYRVDNLDLLLDKLRAAGAQVEDRREDSQYGRFAWVTDPDGNRIELWEPPRQS